MRILVSHAYSKENKGDAALLSVLLQDIPRAFPHPEITVLTLERISPGETVEGFPLKNSFMYHASGRYKHPLLRVLYAFAMAFYTLFWALAYRLTGFHLPLPEHLRDIVHEYLIADLIIPVGGGYILSGPGFMNTARLFFVLHPLLFAHIIGKPTVNYSQSVGAFSSWFQEWMARFTLKRVSGILVRESISYDLLKKWGLTNVYLAADGGVLFEGNKSLDIRKNLNLPEKKMLVGLTVRTQFTEKKQSQFERTIAELLDYIIERYDAHILLVPQVTHEEAKDDDRVSSKNIYELLKHKEHAHASLERYDHHTIKALYSGLDYMIGTRLHSVIFAVTSFVPSIAIEYQYKTTGIIGDLGLRNWIVKIQEVELEDLERLFDKLVASRESYIQNIHAMLPPYQERARQAIFTVQKIYEEYVSKQRAGAGRTT